MIVVDSSVWIAHLRGERSDAVARLYHLTLEADDQILIGDVILLEILQGARDDAHARRLERNLRRFPVVAMLGDGMVGRAAEHYRTLRGLGATLRRTIDLIIGAHCIAHGHALLHSDRDFEPMVRHLGLRAA